MSKRLPDTKNEVNSYSQIHGDPIIVVERDKLIIVPLILQISEEHFGDGAFSLWLKYSEEVYEHDLCYINSIIYLPISLLTSSSTHKGELGLLAFLRNTLLLIIFIA